MVLVFLPVVVELDRCVVDVLDVLAVGKAVFVVVEEELVLDVCWEVPLPELVVKADEDTLLVVALPLVVMIEYRVVV